jgi:hypothetical protein
MTEETNNDGQKMVEISLVRLFMAAIKTSEALKIDVKDYMEPYIDDKKIAIQVDQDNKQFIVSLVEPTLEDNVEEVEDES